VQEVSVRFMASPKLKPTLGILSLS